VAMRHAKGGQMIHPDTPALASPSRSRLAHLSPCGVSTAEAECLTSYVVRLADLHCVEVGTLVRCEIEDVLASAFHQGRQSAGMDQHAARSWAALNGIGTAAQAWVQSLSALTLCSDLLGLTLFPWAAALPPKGLLRPFRAWCPTCIEDWRQAQRPIYDLLLWVIAAVRVCAKHRRPLAERCPNPACGQVIPWFGTPFVLRFLSSNREVPATLSLSSWSAH
jgi:hypothetical protein